MKVCCLFNFAPHYRKQVFKLLEDQFDVEFHFGDRNKGNILPINYNEYHQIKSFMKVYHFGPLLFYKSFFGIIRKSKHKNFLVTGEIKNISLWFSMIYVRIFTNKKICLWTHGWYGSETGIKKVIKKLFFNLSSHIFVYGNYAKEKMILENISPQKISVIYNSLDYDKHLALRKKNKIDPTLFKHIFNNNNSTISYIGRIQEIKRIDLVLEAVYLLKAKEIFVNFFVIGDGEFLSELKRMAKNKDIERQVCFYGACYDEEIISKFIFNSDLIVSPGNIGLTAIHSLSYGTPVLTNSDFMTQMPEFEAIEQGLTGDFFEKDNVDDLVHKIEKWTDSEHLKVKRNVYRENCYLKVDKLYNPYNQISILKEYFEHEDTSN